MKYTKTEQFMLYSLGKWFREANKKIRGKPLQVSISKKLFIDLVRKSGIKTTGERALYRNLEHLEKKKLVSYANKELKLTKKGNTLYSKIKEDLLPYIKVYNKIKKKSAISYTKKIQTVFK